ncbi:hypothetical protein [Dactylosporangium sp. CS-033363]|uniref:hypothetical protein n=1 Tax=Dactylosporangium sp. CS-033363 TaxID=3239935 RepID=UPI003D8D79BA
MTAGARMRLPFPVVSTHHSIVVARSATPLPLLPEVRGAFGTSCFGLVRHDDGWQVARINVRPHQWATVGAGPGPIAAATGSPVLAAWISDFACAQIAAAVPDGPSWAAHLITGGDENCGFDHKIQNTLRAPGPKQPPADPARLAADLAAWSAAGGRTAAAERIEARLRDESGLLQDRYFAMIGELGPGDGVPFDIPDWDDERIREAWHEALNASYDIPTPWNARKAASARSVALVAWGEFHDLAEFDPAITEAELVARAEQALAL